MAMAIAKTSRRRGRRSILAVARDAANAAPERERRREE